MMPVRQFILRGLRRVAASLDPDRRLVEHAEPTDSGPFPMAWPDRYARLQQALGRSLASQFGGRHDAGQMIRHAVSGSIKLADALVLAQLVAETRPAKILEVGSFLGFSTRWLLECSRACGSRVVSLDPRVRHRIFDDIKTHVLSFCKDDGDRLTCIDAYLSERNDAMFLHDYLKYEPVLTREEALAHLAKVPVIDQPFDSFDLAFIDGDHGFAATVLNVHLVARMLTTGGWIVVHDAMSWPDVEPALRALCTERNGLALEAIAGRDFRSRFQRIHDVRLLADGLGLVRVLDADRVRHTDPRQVVRASRG